MEPSQQDPQRLLADLAAEYERSRQFLQQLESSLTRRAEPVLPAYAPTTPSGAGAAEEPVPNVPPATALAASAPNNSTTSQCHQQNHQQYRQQQQQQQQQQAGSLEQPAEKAPESAPSKLKARLRSLFTRRIAVQEDAPAPPNGTASPVVSAARAEAPAATLGRGISARRASLVMLGGGVPDLGRVASGRASLELVREPTQSGEQAAGGQAIPGDRPVGKRRASLIFYSGGVIDASRAAAAAAARGCTETARETPSFTADPTFPATSPAAASDRPATGRRASVVYLTATSPDVARATAMSGVPPRSESEDMLQPTAPRRPATSRQRRGSIVQFANGVFGGSSSGAVGSAQDGGCAVASASVINSDAQVPADLVHPPGGEGSAAAAGGGGSERPATARSAATVYFGSGGVLDSCSDPSDLTRRSTNLQQRPGGALQPTRLKMTNSAHRLSLDVQQQGGTRFSLEGRTHLAGLPSGELPAAPRRGSLDAPRPTTASVRPFMGSSLSFVASALYQSTAQPEPQPPGPIPAGRVAPTGPPPLRQLPGPQVSLAWAPASSPLASPGSGLPSPADAAGLLPRGSGSSSSTGMRRASMCLSAVNSIVRRNLEEPAPLQLCAGAPLGSENSCGSQVGVTAAPTAPAASEPNSASEQAQVQVQAQLQLQGAAAWTTTSGSLSRPGSAASAASAVEPNFSTPMRSRCQTHPTALPQPQPQPPQTPQQQSYVRVRSIGGTVTAEGAARARRGSAFVCSAQVEEHMRIGASHEEAVRLM